MLIVTKYTLCTHICNYCTIAWILCPIVGSESGHIKRLGLQYSLRTELQEAVILTIKTRFKTPAAAQMLDEIAKCMGKVIIHYVDAAFEVRP